jgi:hypothetical protein
MSRKRTAFLSPSGRAWGTPGGTWTHDPAPNLAARGRERHLAVENVERLDVPAVDVRRRRRRARVAPDVRDPDLLHVGEQRHPQAAAVGDEPLTAEDGVLRRPAAVRRRRMLVACSVS